MIKKCLSRGDDILAANEFNMWKKAFVKLARMKADPDLQEYGFYHVNRLQQQMGDNGKFYRDLIAMNNTTLTADKFAQFHEYAMRFAQEHHTQAYNGHKEAFERITRDIQDGTPVQGGDATKIAKSVVTQRKFKG